MTLAKIKKNDINSFFFSNQDANLYKVLACDKFHDRLISFEQPVRDKQLVYQDVKIKGDEGKLCFYERLSHDYIGSVSCNCDEFQESSIGICKHVVFFGLYALGPFCSAINCLIPLNKERTYSVRHWNPVKESWITVGSGEEVTTFSASKKLSEVNWTDEFKEFKSTTDFPKLHLKPFEYQREAYWRMLFAKKLILAMPMGSGKTYTSIGALKTLFDEGKINSVLIVCPNSLKIQWKRELDLVFSPDDSKIINKSKDAQQISQAKIAIITYQMMAKGKITIPDLGCLILDEVQTIRNSETKAWKCISKIASHYCFALSGTIIENKVDDLYSVLKIIKKDVENESIFKVKYCRYEIKGSRPTFQGWKNVDWFINSYQKHIFTIDAETFNKSLPEINKVSMPCSLTKEQADLDAAYRQQAARILSRGAIRPLTIGERQAIQGCLLKARRICNSLRLNDRTKPPSSKEKCFSKLLEELCTEKKEKIVVYSEWIDMLNVLAETCAQKGIKFVYHTGTETIKVRQESLRAFIEDSDVMIFFSTDSGGVGLDGLQIASKNIIHAEYPWNPAKLDQREGRLKRIGQKNQVTSYTIFASAGIEKEIENTLKEKRDIRQTFMDFI